MTDHKYPNEITSCHSMLKKRDIIIDELNERLATKGNRHDLAEEEVTLRDADYKKLEEEITRLEEDIKLTKDTNQSLFKACDEFKIDVVVLKATIAELEETIVALRKQLDTEVKGAEARIDDKVTMLVPNEELTKYQEQIKLLEEKLALCDSQYKELKWGLETILKV